MYSRGLIASWLLVTVLLAPVMGLAVCVSAFPAAKTCHMAGCAMNIHGAGLDAGSHHRAPASAPVAPCCQRKAPMPALGESSALIVAPVQVGLMPAAAPVAMLPAMLAVRVEKLASPPLLTPPLLLLCTLLI